MSIQVYSNQPSVSAQADSQSQAVETQTPVSAEQSAGQNDADASETSEAEAKEASSEEDTDSSEEGDEVSAKESDSDEKQSKPKKKGGWQRQKEKAEREAIEARRELEHWKAVALKQGASEAKQETPKQDAKPSQEGKPNPDDFETHLEYVEALTEWKAEQKFLERDQKAEQARLRAEQDKLVNSHRERVKSFMDKTEDFADAMESVDDVRISAAVQQLIVESENGPELMYALAKDREEFERICSLPPLAAARAMGKLEAKIASKATGATQRTEPKKQTTQAPAPITPVGSKGGKVTKDIFDPNIPFSEYEATRIKQRAARQQRW